MDHAHYYLLQMEFRKRMALNLSVKHHFIRKRVPKVYDNKFDNFSDPIYQTFNENDLIMNVTQTRVPLFYT